MGNKINLIVWMQSDLFLLRGKMKPIALIFGLLQICLGLFTPVGFFAIIMPWVLFFCLSNKNKKKIQTLLFYKRA